MSGMVVVYTWAWLTSIIYCVPFSFFLLPYFVIINHRYIIRYNIMFSSITILHSLLLSVHSNYIIGETLVVLLGVAVRRRESIGLDVLHVA